MGRPKALTKNEAIKCVRITEERHRALRQLALDSDANLIGVTDEVVDAGLKAVHERRTAVVSAN